MGWDVIYCPISLSQLILVSPHECHIMSHPHRHRSYARDTVVLKTIYTALFAKRIFTVDSLKDADLRKNVPLGGPDDK